MSSKMSRMCDKSVFVIFRPININYCHSRGCNLEYNLHSVFSQRPCSPDTYFALQYYSRLHYFALYFACFLSLKRIGSLVNEDDDFHNLFGNENMFTFIHYLSSGPGGMIAIKGCLIDMWLSQLSTKLFGAT